MLHGGLSLSASGAAALIGKVAIDAPTKRRTRIFFVSQRARMRDSLLTAKVSRPLGGHVRSDWRFARAARTRATHDLPYYGRIWTKQGDWGTFNSLIARQPSVVRRPLKSCDACQHCRSAPPERYGQQLPASN
jgi:hypothetical protein